MHGALTQKHLCTLLLSVVQEVGALQRRSTAFHDVLMPIVHEIAEAETEDQEDAKQHQVRHSLVLRGALCCHMTLTLTITTTTITISVA